MSAAPTRQARLVELPQFTDPRGAIVVAQHGQGLPFVVRRARWIHSVVQGATRGGHAHRATEQLFVAVAGRASALVYDGETQRQLPLERPDVALYVSPMVWVELHDFTPGTVVLLLSSTEYDEGDYIRDRAALQL